MGLTTKLIAIIAAIIIAAIGSFAAYTYIQLQNVEVEKVQAIADRDSAAAARDEALNVLANNEISIKKLEKEKADIQAALNVLEADKRRNQAIINNLSAAIKAQADNPANKVELSPVLRSTVEAIQQQRAQREDVK